MSLGVASWRHHNNRPLVHRQPFTEVIMTLILDGKFVSATIRQEIRTFLQTQPRSPHLVVALTHPHLASSIYVRNKLTACKEVGIRATIIEHACTSTEQILDLLAPWNANDDVDGILVQFPVHPHVDQQRVIQALDPMKDVDGVHPVNLGKLVLGDPSGFVPCTPLGIQTLLAHYGITLEGKHVVIIGRSITVGKPLALLLCLKGPYANATVTIAHRGTKNLARLCAEADVIVAAAGAPGLVQAEMIKDGAIVVDVGINRVQTDEKVHLVGDVDFERVSKRCSAITPVPGGIGPMTIACLLKNTVKSFSQRQAS
jgi:methylenetetrahydrofolate dehydrogenase (NADP+)/methenyltetrahydrofolate cyclohydrolase